MRSFFATILIGAIIAGAAAARTANTSASPDQLQISDFRSGLVCPQTDADHGSICVETTNIPVTGEGACIYDHAQYRCTWYGFEFDYAHAQSGDEISCVVTSNHYSDTGGPEGVRQRHSNHFEFQLRLEKANGHYYNPQYSVFSPNATGREQTVDETVCSFGARELFRFRVELSYPV